MSIHLMSSTIRDHVQYLCHGTNQGKSSRPIIASFYSSHVQHTVFLHNHQIVSVICAQTNVVLEQVISVVVVIASTQPVVSCST